MFLLSSMANSYQNQLGQDTTPPIIKDIELAFNPDHYQFEISATVEDDLVAKATILCADRPK